MVEMHYNSDVHESTGKTPYEMNGVDWRDPFALAMQEANGRDDERRSATDRRWHEGGLGGRSSSDAQATGAAEEVRGQVSSRREILP